MSPHWPDYWPLKYKSTKYGYLRIQIWIYISFISKSAGHFSEILGFHLNSLEVNHLLDILTLYNL